MFFDCCALSFQHCLWCINRIDMFLLQACYLCKQKSFWRCVRCMVASHDKCAAFPEGVIHLNNHTGRAVCWRHPADWWLEKVNLFFPSSVWFFYVLRSFWILLLSLLLFYVMDIALPHFIGVILRFFFSYRMKHYWIYYIALVQALASQMFQASIFFSFNIRSFSRLNIVVANSCVVIWYSEQLKDCW